MSFENYKNIFKKGKNSDKEYVFEDNTSDIDVYEIDLENDFPDNIEIEETSDLAVKKPLFRKFTTKLVNWVNSKKKAKDEITYKKAEGKLKTDKIGIFFRKKSHATNNGEPEVETKEEDKISKNDFKRTPKFRKFKKGLFTVVKLPKKIFNGIKNKYESKKSDVENVSLEEVIRIKDIVKNVIKDDIFNKVTMYLNESDYSAQEMENLKEDIKKVIKNNDTAKLEDYLIKNKELKPDKRLSALEEFMSSLLDEKLDNNIIEYISSLETNDNVMNSIIERCIELQSDPVKYATLIEFVKTNMNKDNKEDILIEFLKSLEKDIKLIEFTKNNIDKANKKDILIESLKSLEKDIKLQSIIEVYKTLKGSLEDKKSKLEFLNRKFNLLYNHKVKSAVYVSEEDWEKVYAKQAEIKNLVSEISCLEFKASVHKKHIISKYEEDAAKLFYTMPQ